MKLYIITFEGSTTIDKCVERYKELGYDPIIYQGKSIVKDNIPSSKVAYINYRTLLNEIDYNSDILISEDDAYLNEKIVIENTKEINWLGYWAVRKTLGVMGGMLLYFPKNKIENISHLLNTSKPVHLDMFLDRFLDFILRPKTITKEIEHYSLIVKKIRKHKNVIKI
tara:strand:+ start:187 stop:690 length:504 start_codon:yes stop_codon:yes gene_type:complete